MREFIRLVHSEFYKMKHTVFFVLHLIVPAFGIFVFLCYYGVSPHKWEEELLAYITVLTVALPLSISIVCAQAVSYEEGNHFLAFLGTALKRRHAFWAKWFLVFFMGLLAMALTVGGFMAGYCLLLRRCDFDLWFTAAVTLVMWIGSAGMYVSHMFLNLWKPKSVSLGIGMVESASAALLLTGLGDGLWQFLPCAYGGHWEEIFMRYWFYGSVSVSYEFIRNSLFINVLVTAGIIMAAVAGFHFYEGRRVND